MFYNGKIKTQKGTELALGYKAGILFDVNDLSGIEVNIQKSQGFQQMGETVDRISVDGAVREISGKILTDSAQRKMMSVLQVDTVGTLTINDTYACDFVMKSTPFIKKVKGEVKFMFRIFCPMPFWRTENMRTFNITSFEPLFSFPVCYDSHSYGSEKTFIANCKNDGTIEVPFRIKITAEGECSNIVFLNSTKGEGIKINTSLAVGDTLIYDTFNDTVTVTKINASGEKTNMLDSLDGTTSFFRLASGDNVIEIVATGRENVNAVMEAPIYYSGAIV